MSWLSDRDYNYIYSRATRICVDLVIKTDDGVFMIKRDEQPYKGKYHLPGGRIRFRENILKAIRRIAKTEIGCNVVIGTLLGFMDFPKEIQYGNKRHSMSLAFLVSPLEKIDVKKIDVKKIHPVHYKFLRSIKYL